jgi:hypothetical protein
VNVQDLDDDLEDFGDGLDAGGSGPAQRWVPDEFLVASVLGSPRAFRRMSELGLADRAWLVAGLTLAGLTAGEIASRLSCSVRLVKSVRADPVAGVAVWCQGRVGGLESELRGERVAHSGSRQELARVRGEVLRLRRQVDDLVDALAVGGVDSCRRGHPLVPYNTYRHGGKRFCRTCHRERQAGYRAAAVRGLGPDGDEGVAGCDQDDDGGEGLLAHG